MNENEIVDYLKENKTKGVAFGFMPEEVKKWCSDNDSKLVYYSVNGSWFSGDNRSIFDCNEIVALPETYETEINDWLEFDIDDTGRFFFKFIDKNGSSVSRSFYWYQWQEFLNYCDLNNLSTGFGGWNYKEDPNEWDLTPQVKVVEKESGITDFYTRRIPTKPIVPIKIRFWRGSLK